MPGASARRFHEPTVGVRMVAGRDRIALCGRLDRILEHAHATPAVVVGIDGPLRFVAGRAHASRAALLAPGFAHAVDTSSGRIAVFLLPPDRRSGQGGSGQGLAPIADLPRADRWIEMGSAVLDGTLGGFDAVDRELGSTIRPLDDRILRVLEALEHNLEDNVPIESIAASVRLSPSRLMALTRAELGTSLRKYRRWLRAFEVARAFAEGATLTEAALAAGFASSAHLAVAAREQFGIRPSDILRPEHRALIRRS